MSFNLNLAYGGTVFYSQNTRPVRDINSIERFVGYHLGIIIQNPKSPNFIVKGYQIKEESINKLLDAIFESAKQALYFVAINTNSLEETGGYSAKGLIYTDKIDGLDGFSTKQEFKEWLFKEEYNFLALERSALNLKPDKIFYANTYLWKDLIKQQGLIHQVKCWCYEKDILTDGFVGHTIGFGDSYHTALRKAQFKCSQNVKRANFLNEAKKNNIKFCAESLVPIEELK